MFLIRPHLFPVYQIQIKDGRLSREFRTAYRPFLFPSYDGDYDSIDITGETLIYNGTAVAAPDPMQELENILYRTVRVEDGYCALHAGAVEWGGKAYILLGDTEAGKSTLTTYLCHRGFGYLSDDLAIINKASNTVSPYPRPVQLRDGGVEVLRRLGISLDNGEVCGEGKLRRTVITLPARDGNYEIGGFYVIKRTDHNAVLPIPKPQAMMRLMQSQFAFAPTTGESLQFLSKLCEKPMAALCYWDMDYAKDVLTGEK